MARIKIIDDAKIWPIIQEIEETDARAAAIMMGAFLENWLGLALLQRMRPLGKDKRDHLFGESGPLGTFSQKIEMAYALNLVGPDHRSDLLNIKQVRNHFAHEVEITDFFNPSVVGWCMALRYPKAKAKSINRDEEMDPETRFFDSGHHLAVGFSHLCDLELPKPVNPGLLLE
jgi:hypothetical protein